MTGESETLYSDPVDNLIYNVAGTWRNFIVDDSGTRPDRKAFWVGFLTGMLLEIDHEVGKAAVNAWYSSKNPPDPKDPCSTL